MKHNITILSSILGISLGLGTVCSTQANNAISIKIQDVGSSLKHAAVLGGKPCNGTDNSGCTYDRTLDGRAGGFKFAKINPTSYQGTSLWTGDVGNGTIDLSVANPINSFTTGFVFLGAPFVPFTSGPTIGDLTGTTLTFDNVSFGGQYNGLVDFFLDADPGRLLINWVEPTLDPNKFLVQFQFAHLITPAESVSFAGFDTRWLLEGILTVENIIPEVIAISPSPGGENVATNADISVTFNEVMDPATITGGGLSVNPGNVCAGNVSTVDNLTFVCDAGTMAASTAYTITLNTAVADAGATTVASEYTSTFTTGANVDSIAPTVSLTTPADTSIEISTAHAITINFADDISAADNLGSMSVQTLNSISVTDGVTPVSGTTITSDNLSFVFTPFALLAANTPYTITVSASSAIDNAGNPLTTDSITTFTTGASATQVETVTGARVSIDEAGGSSLTFMDTKSEGQVGGRITWDDEFITYTINNVTTNPGVTVDFPQVLTGKNIYRVSANGAYTLLVEGGDYQLVDNNTITVTLADNGPFDSNKATGFITDTLIAGIDPGETADAAVLGDDSSSSGDGESGGIGSISLFASLMFLLLPLRLIYRRK